MASPSDKIIWSIHQYAQTLPRVDASRRRTACARLGRASLQRGYKTRESPYSRPPFRTASTPITNATPMRRPVLAAVLASVGLLAYALSQSCRTGVAVACYAAAGLTLGIAAPATPAVIVGCTAARGACSLLCAS
ncbi:hypothetical protein HYPSUDRAFT_219482 [Hypholoma sublateritium FD-334 SS-4]|uniref:Uncharacterized protein n=1 Tax=Hypholoma sublateritium (strain FD-334 SS-4) TaxID=945553 RepID=A0A0D2LZM5_HYPSF|nr:hypothetical protein HYPSUDRAFT_219482 [Hypholoma sublateritium FD-334 SS-4]